MNFELSTLGGLLERRAADHASNTFLLFEQQTWTYQELNRDVDRIAAGLAQAGVVKGTLVNIHLSNRPEFVIVFFALAKLGAIMVPTNLALRENELGYILHHSEATFGITESAYLEIYNRVLPACPNVHTLILADTRDKSISPANQTISWHELMASETDCPSVSLEPADTVLIMYTSGTTALPKGAMISHRNVLSAGHSWMWMVGFASKDRTMTGLPMFHANALFFSCVGSMVCGGSFVLLPAFRPSQYFNLARRYGATHFNLLGPAMAIMLQQPTSPEDREHPVRIVHDAMGTAEMIERWSVRFDIPVVMAYNLTESTIATGTPVSGPQAIKLGSIGWAAPSLPFPTEVKVFLEDGVEAPPQVVGEIVVRGPAVMKGYFKQPEQTAKAIRDGWLYTGDAGYCEADGCMWFVDRLKDMVKPRGENVSSAEVEGVLLTHPLIAEVGIIGVMDPITGEEIKASILLRQNETASSLPPTDILSWCEERLAGFKVPRFIEYRSTPVPRTLGGAKILKRELRNEKANPTQGCYDRRNGRWLE